MASTSLSKLCLRTTTTTKQCRRVSFSKGRGLSTAATRMNQNRVRQSMGTMTTPPRRMRGSVHPPLFSAGAVNRFSTTTLTTPSSSDDPREEEEIVHNNQKKGFLSRLWERYSIGGQQNTILRAEQFFQAATQQGMDPRWYGPGRIERTFRSKHAMLTMHLWFLHKRLVADTHDEESALRIQEELFDIFWQDTMCRIRQAGVRELSVHKNLMTVQQYTFLHLFSYDHVYSALTPRKEGEPEPDPVSWEDHREDFFADDTSSSSDHRKGDQEAATMMPFDTSLDLTKQSNRIQELKKLVWMHIMVRDRDAKRQEDHLTRMAWYIEAQYQNIVRQWPDEYYHKARVAWVDLPNFSNLRDGRSAEGSAVLLPEQSAHPDDLLPFPWRSNITLRGETYYWNTETRESQWEKPDYLQDNTLLVAKP